MDQPRRHFLRQASLLGLGLLYTGGLLGLSGCQTRPSWHSSGDLAVVIGRASGELLLVNTTRLQVIGRVQGLGDLSHASAVFSRDQRFVYIFGRDGGLSKVDLAEQRLSKRLMQSGNSIGGAISQDGRLIAVSNYQPGGVKVFASDTLELVADLPALDDQGRPSKVVGLVDAPGQRFVYSLFDSNEIRIADFSQGQVHIQRFPQVGKQPYDALIFPDGRYYLAGLFGEDGLALVDLWHPERGSRKVLPHYGRGQQKLPVYKMPHLEGWAVAGNLAFVPAVGEHAVLVIDSQSWQQYARIAVAGQPVFVMASPDSRHIWVNFAHPDNHQIQVIDADTLQVVQQLQPGPGVLHMEFSPRGEQLWLSVRDANQVQVYRSADYQLLASFDFPSPSGIFMSARAHQIGL